MRPGKVADKLQLNSLLLRCETGIAELRLSEECGQLQLGLYGPGLRGVSLLQQL
jgi:hypothetical protein